MINAIILFPGKAIDVRQDQSEPPAILMAEPMTLFISQICCAAITYDEWCKPVGG